MSRQSTPGKSRAAAHHQHPQRHQRERRQPEAHALTHQWGFWLLPVLIALVTFVPFLPTLDNQFVNWTMIKISSRTLTIEGLAGASSAGCGPRFTWATTSP